MDQLYFSSISNILADFFMLRAETLPAIQELSQVTRAFDRHSPEKYEFGLYMGQVSGQAGYPHKQISINLSAGLAKKNKETFQKLCERAEKLIDRLKMAIVPPSLTDLHNMLKEIADLHLKGYGLALELLNTGNLSLLPVFTSTFEECSTKLLLFEKMQRSLQKKS